MNYIFYIRQQETLLIELIEIHLCNIMLMQSVLKSNTFKMTQTEFFSSSNFLIKFIKFLHENSFKKKKISTYIVDVSIPLEKVIMLSF